jgi:hypothetical protein
MRSVLCTLTGASMIVAICAISISPVHHWGTLRTEWTALEGPELEFIRGADANDQTATDPCGNPRTEDCAYWNLPSPGRPTYVSDVECAYQEKNSNPNGGCHFVYTNSQKCVECDDDYTPTDIIQTVANGTPPGLMDVLQENQCDGARNLGVCGAGDCTMVVPDGTDCSNPYYPTTTQ